MIQKVTNLPAARQEDQENPMLLPALLNMLNSYKISKLFCKNLAYLTFTASPVLAACLAGRQGFSGFRAFFEYLAFLSNINFNIGNWALDIPLYF